MKLGAFFVELRPEPDTMPGAFFHKNEHTNKQEWITLPG